MCSTSTQDQYDLYCETLEIRRSVLCIICLGEYCNPVSLPCSHSFCKDCILEASKVKLKCPICSYEFTKRSITSLNHLSPLVSDIAALVKSLTGSQRYSISQEDMDKQCKERQRVLTSGHLHSHIYLLPPSVSKSPAHDVINSVIHQDNIPADNVLFTGEDENCPCPNEALPGLHDYDECEPSLQLLQLPRKKQIVNSSLVSHESRNTDITTGEIEVLLEEIPTSSTASTMVAACLVPMNINATTESNVCNVLHPLTSAEKKDVASDNLLVLEEAVHLLPNLPSEQINFRPGEVVEVSPRMWTGMNKPGGAAWVLAVHECSTDSTTSTPVCVTYDVKYVLNGNTDWKVPCVFISVHQELERSSRKRGAKALVVPETSIACDGGMAHKRRSNATKVSRMSDSVSPSLNNANSVCTSNSSSTKSSVLKGNQRHNVQSMPVKPQQCPKISDGNYSNDTTPSNSERKRKSRICPSASATSALTQPSCNRKFRISHTSLENSDFIKLQKFCDHFGPVQCGNKSAPMHSESPTSSSSTCSSSAEDQVGVIFTEKLDSTVTHLVVSVDKKGMLRKRTLKFMQAIMGGLWILSPRWLADSLLADNILSEEGYEVPGYQKAGTAFAPQRARLRVCAALALSPRDVGMARSSSGHVIDSTQNRPRNTSQNPESTVQDPSPSLLFNGMVFLLYGSFPNSGPPRSDIADLLRRGQGTVVSTIKELLATCSDHVPVGIKKSKGLSECNDDVIGMTRHHSPNHVTAKAVATSSCSKIVLCTDKESVLLFLEDFSDIVCGLRSKEATSAILENDDDKSVRVKGDQEVRQLRESGIDLNTPAVGRLILRMSEKYTVEGMPSGSPAITDANSRIQGSCSGHVGSIVENDRGKENVENGCNSVLGKRDRVTRAEEVTVLNPTWVYDSISNYLVTPTQ